MKESCERLWEIDALREGRLLASDAAANARHQTTCSVCRARFAADERLAELGRALPVNELDPLRSRRLRARILRGAAAPPTSLRPWLRASALAAVLMLVVGAVAVFLVRRHPETSGAAALSTVNAPSSNAFASQVKASADARWSRQRDGDVEHVRLDEGTLSIEVRKQRLGERFLVDLPNGQIEVRGTRFDVTVRDRETTSIRVDDGVITFRRDHANEVLLHAGERWDREPPVATVSSLRPTPVRSAPRSRDAELAATDYEAAISAYREHDYATASGLFGRFLVNHPDAREAEDAAFLEANSAAHAARGDEAAVLAKRFLKRYPTSFHARDAAVLVARSARDHGDCATARSVLEPWSASNTADVANALGACARHP